MAENATKDQGDGFKGDEGQSYLDIRKKELFFLAEKNFLLPKYTTLED